MLAEWPDSISELAINESAAVLAEHATKQKFNELTHNEVKIKIASVVNKTAVKLTSFKTMELSPVTTSAVANLNAQLGKHNTTAGTTPLLRAATWGSFHKYVQGESPVMKAADCMDDLAMQYCLMLHEDP